ncbi:fumarylacetoacetate hydrolase family protein [Alteribacter populi]|uniref:fumarylacetoacetate hydrolase family protein n=1 Tax=Alteribacter populi TaxID=2011011 RepID=UPI000BBB1015|nr:fumarylacetoacetate hydrolase family protein [Alteribacter populi]
MQKVRVKLSGQRDDVIASLDQSKSSIFYQGIQRNMEELQYETPVTGTVYGTLLNYKGELAKLGDAVNQDPYNQPPQAPVLYIKPRNTHTSHKQPIPLPKNIEFIQTGATLGIVIGKTATKLKKESALDYVMGYTVVNDVTVPHESVFRPAVKHRSRDGFCPMGPWIVEKDSFESPNSVSIRTWVNGKLVQENTTANLIRSVEQLLEDITEFMTLYQGDTLLIGVAEDAPLVQAYDHVRIEIDGAGFLENTILPEQEIPLKGGNR